MHSFEAMNNIFEILNKEFDHHHKPSFTQEEFNKFFGRDSDLSHGFFGEYSQLVSTITFTGELANPSLFSVLESELSKQKIVLKQTAIDAACPGLTCMIPSPKYFNLVLHSELSQILLPTVCSVVNQTASKPFNASVDFVDGVQSCGQEQRVSARAYGTEFVVQANGRLCFRSIQLENMHFKPLYLKSESAIQPHDLRDLIISLFESQMIELRPEQSTTELTQVLKILGRRRR